MTNNVNKIALVTGSSRGLGKDMALQLAKKGFDVVITYHSKKAEAENVVTEIKATGRKAYALQLDVSQSSSFDGFADKFKSVLQLNLTQTVLMHW